MSTAHYTVEQFNQPAKVVMLTRPRCPSCSRALPLKVNGTKHNTEHSKQQHILCKHCGHTWVILWS